MNFPVSPTPDARAWQLSAAQQLRMVDGEDESVLYNDRSGETHLLSAIAVSLLQQLARGPADFPSIAAFLASAWEFDSDDDLRQTSHRLLAELEALSLIEIRRS